MAKDRLAPPDGYRPDDEHARLLRGDERDFCLQKVEPSETRPVELGPEHKPVTAIGHGAFTTEPTGPNANALLEVLLRVDVERARDAAPMSAQCPFHSA